MWFIRRILKVSWKDKKTNDEGLNAAGVNITKQNILVFNGYVHILDGIMAPPAGNAVDVINSNGALTSYVSLLWGTGLLEFIRCEFEMIKSLIASEFMF
ncbi:fasciclin-like protein precursor [Elysia marginata]|uniref:Fasciclin-like protein n=1 Tax=Elysia marginata TaxID=1093978 RepID=A0AAV4H4F7_9GAST|nr:fasciclin-like protein precursor [Elysia marginata]